MAASAVLHDVQEYLSQPARLKAITLHHGINDNVVPVTDAWVLAETLARAGIACMYEEHSRGHIWRPEDTARAAAKVFGGQVPQVESAGASTTSAKVGESVDFGIHLSLSGPVPASGLFPELWVDFSPVQDRGVSRLEHDGNGAYTARHTVIPEANGWSALPVTMGEEGRTLLTLPLAVYPEGDAVILGDRLAPGWQDEAKGGAAPLGFTGEGPVFRGEKAAGFQVEPASFVGWSVQWAPEHPVSDFGYASLVFAFHPGDATGSSLNLVVGGGGVKLLGGRNEEPVVDLELKEWQAVELALWELAPGSIDQIGFNGNLKGAFYIDDMRLVAGTAPPDPPPTAVAEEVERGRPAHMELHESFPNPFNSSVTLRFSLAQQQSIALTVYNLAGQQIATLASGLREAGTHTLRWNGVDGDGRELGSGVYLCQLQAGGQVETRKLMLLR